MFVSQSDVERHTLAKYLMELTLIDYDMVHYRPSEIAAASLCLAQRLLEGLPWVSLELKQPLLKYEASFNCFLNWSLLFLSVSYTAALLYI